MRIYLSGPMTGRPDYNFPLFNKIAEELRQRHHEVLNPAELHPDVVPGTWKWTEYLKSDIKAMMDYDTLVLLPEWDTSRGARVELNLADVLEYHVFEVDPETFELKPTEFGNQDMTVLS